MGAQRGGEGLPGWNEASIDWAEVATNALWQLMVWEWRLIHWLGEANRNSVQSSGKDRVLTGAGLCGGGIPFSAAEKTVTSP